MARRRRLLFITDVFPFPLDRGQRVRVHNLLASCARAFDVTFVGPPPDRDGHGESVESRCAATHYLAGAAAKGPASWRVLARAAYVSPGIPQPSTVARYVPFVAALRALDPSRFDLVWAERLHIARLCARPHLRARTVVDLDDLEHVKLARRIKLDPLHVGPRDLWRYALYRRSELFGARRFAAAVVCSDQDRARLSRHGSENAVVVPNGVDLPANVPLDGRRSTAGRAPRLVFLGNLGYEPNADAVTFFADQVLPRLDAELPGTRLDVVGPGTMQGGHERWGSRVTFRGFVEDLASALREQDIMVAPIRFGGGTKLKVLDAMAHGVPLVTTSIGAEGLSLMHGEHAWIADSAEGLAEGVVRLTREPALADRLAQQAFALVRDRFSWSAIQARTADWLAGLEPSR